MQIRVTVVAYLFSAVVFTNPYNILRILMSKKMTYHVYRCM